MKGKLIVICGTDGSGKGTQVNLLFERLKKEGYMVKVTDFPRYGHKSAGLVEEYLNGQYGTADEVGPYRGSIFYAVDRYAASKEMHEWLAKGGLIISNRYVSANKGHQMSKITDIPERIKFLSWLNELEYGIFGIPKEDINFLLYVPPEIGQQLVDQKGHRDYIGKKRDILEADLDHLKKAAEAYKFVADLEKWHTISCVKEGKMQSIEIIHEMVYKHVMDVLGEDYLEKIKMQSLKGYME